MGSAVKFAVFPLGLEDPPVLRGFRGQSCVVAMLLCFLREFRVGSAVIFVVFPLGLEVCAGGRCKFVSYMSSVWLPRSMLLCCHFGLEAVRELSAELTASVVFLVLFCSCLNMFRFVSFLLEGAGSPVQPPTPDISGMSFQIQCHLSSVKTRVHHHLSRRVQPKSSSFPGVTVTPPLRCKDRHPTSLGGRRGACGGRRGTKKH